MKTIVITLLVLAGLYMVYRSYRFLNLDKGLDQKVRNGAVILDVRTESEYRTGHIEGSVNIPLSRLHADTVPLDPSKVYITVCSHGLRSVKAAALLREKGYKQVYNGGAWSDLQQTLAGH
ncbi:rhodanese-like domain-containing protein [Taibaiella chishuiensis]|uniref:Phage shock protein E n=1 Tax=Taibaiella chishuiensis TaxID=1434707 RepID=A0A2P8D1M4_9BACT|nr:rhodanese-like domain-containing protein [Taibaiella chishuiensis]PSK91115.1 phage shock protein E [Taibaiella chishuiensis]